MQMSTMDTETGEMIVKRVSVPIGLEELMEGLTKEILLKKPDDIYLFAAEYFAQLLLLREKGSYKVKPLRTAHSISRQAPKQPPEKLIIRGASKQLSRQISVRGESPVKRVAPIKKPLPRKDHKEDGSVDKSRFIDRKNKPKPAEAKNIEDKSKRIISRTTSENSDILNKRDRSVSSSRRGRSVTKSVQGTPRQKSTSTPRRAQNATEIDKLNKQNKYDAKQQESKIQHEVKKNPPVPKISSVEEDQSFIKDGKSTVTSPKIIKHPQAPENDEIISSLIKPQAGENVAHVIQINKIDKGKDEITEKTTNKELKNHQIKNDPRNEVVNETQNKIDTDLNNTSSVSTDDDNFSSETKSISSIDGKPTPKNLSNVDDITPNELKSVDVVEKRDGSHGINNTGNTSDDQITNLFTDDSSTSEILDKDTEDTKLTKNENEPLSNIEEYLKSSSSLNKTANNKVVNDESNSNLTFSVSNVSDNMANSLIPDHQSTLKDEFDATSIETPSEVENNIISENNEDEEKRSSKEESILDSGKNINISENNELDKEVQKKHSDDSFRDNSLEEMLENDVHQQDNGTDIKPDKESEKDESKKKEETVFDSTEHIREPEKDNLGVDKDEIDHKYSNKEGDAGIKPINLLENVAESVEREHVDLSIDKKENIDNQLEENSKIISNNLKDGSIEQHTPGAQFTEMLENDINLTGKENNEIKPIRVKREAAAFDDNTVTNISETDKNIEVIESGENKIKDNERDNDYLKEQNAKEISKFNDDSHYDTQESSDRLGEERHDDDIPLDSNKNSIKDKVGISETEQMPRTVEGTDIDKDKVNIVTTEQEKANCITDTLTLDKQVTTLKDDDENTHSFTESEAKKSVHKESSESNEDMARPKTDINAAENVENMSTIDREKTKELMKEHLIGNVENIPVIDKENATELLIDVDHTVSQRDKKVNDITNSGAIHDAGEIKEAGEVETDNEKSISSLSKEGTPMEEQIGQISEDSDDKTESVNTIDATKENEKAKIETTLLKSDNKIKSNGEINKESDEENSFSVSEKLNTGPKSNINVIKNVENMSMTDKGNTREPVKDHLIQNIENVPVTDKINATKLLTDVDHAVRQHDKDTTNSGAMHDDGAIHDGGEVKDAEEIVNDKEKSTSRLSKEGILMKEQTDQISGDPDDKTDSMNTIDAMKENEKAKIEIALLESDNKNTEEINKESDEANTFSVSEKLNTSENINKKNEQLEKPESTMLADNVITSSIKENLDNEQGIVYNKNFQHTHESNVNEMGNKANVKETPVHKDENNAIFVESKNLEGETGSSATDINYDTETNISNKEMGQDINDTKFHASSKEDEGLQNTDPGNREEFNKNSDMKNNDTNSSLNLTSIDKSTMKSESETLNNKPDLQTRGSKDDLIKSINSVINIAKEGPVDDAVKKYIGEFIQQEQHHVFVEHSGKMNSEDVVDENTKSKEMTDNILVEETEALTNGANEVEPSKVERQDPDKDLTKNDVMKNVINSTISLAQTGKVDEILKVHIKDFLSKEKSNVFSENTETSNIADSSAECHQKQTITHENESSLKEATHKPVEADSTKISESIIRKESSKNLNQPEIQSQKVKQSGKNIKPRSSAQVNTKENFKQNNNNKAEKKLRRVKTVDVLTDLTKPKIEVKSRIPTADYRNRVKREKENGKHSILIRQTSNSQEVVNKLSGKAVGAVNKIDKNIDSITNNKQSDEMVKDHINEDVGHKKHKETEAAEEYSKNVKEVEKSELHKSGFDNSKLRDELKAVEAESKFATFKPSFNPYVLRQEIKNASLLDINDETVDNKEHNNILTQVAAALKIQSLWRGFKVRKNKAQILPQQAIEPETIIKRKVPQLMLHIEDLKKNDITENDLKPDGTITEKEDPKIENKGRKEDLEGINESGKNREVKLNSEEDQNQDATKSSVHHIDDVKMSPQEADVAVAGNKDYQLVPQGDGPLKETNTIHSDSVTIEKTDTNIETANSKSKSGLGTIIKTENNLDSLVNGDNSNKINEDKFIEAAVIIQKIWRAFHVRKNIKQKYLDEKSSDKNNASLQENKLSSKMDAESEHDNNTFESENSLTATEKFTKAAITIQKIWRGFKIRRNIKENYRNKDNVTELYNNDFEETVKQSSIESKEIKTGILSTDLSLPADDKFKKAAIIIQKLWRGFNTRKILKQTDNQGSTKMDYQVKSDVQSTEINKENNKKESTDDEQEIVNKKVFENVKSKSTQEISPDLTDSKNDDQFVKAVTKIQALWRGFQVRKVLKTNNKQDVSIGQVNRENNNGASGNDEFIKAAIKIQKIWRGFKVRKVLKKNDLFGSKVESEKPVIESMKTAEEIHPKDKKSALKIQSLWRGYQVRKNINIIKDKLEEKITANDAGKGKELTDGDILNAATKIQAGVRGYLQRKKFKRDVTNLNSIAEEDNEEKYNVKNENAVSENTESLITPKSTKDLDKRASSETRQLTEDEVFKALEDLNKLEVPNDVPLTNETTKPTFYRSHTVQEPDIVKKQSSPLLQTVSLSEINNTHEGIKIPTEKQSTNDFRDSNNNSSNKLIPLEVEVKNAIQNITKINGHELLSDTIPPLHGEVKATPANTITDSETLISKDTKQLDSNEGTYLGKQGDNTDSIVKSDLHTESMDEGNNTIQSSKVESTSTVSVPEYQQTESDNISDNNYNSDLQYDNEKMSSTNNVDVNFHKQNNNNKHINKPKDTTESKVDESIKETEIENLQSTKNKTSELAPSGSVDVVKDTLSKDKQTNKTLEKKLIQERPVSIDSTDSAITVINNELSSDNEEDNNENEGVIKNNLAEEINILADDHTKGTLLEHENLINKFQNKLLEQISGKNGEKTSVEDATRKFDIDQLRKELEEAGLIYNSDDTINIQHQNSKEESNVHDQLFDYLHNLESAKLDAEGDSNINSSSRDLPDIKEEDTDTKSVAKANIDESIKGDKLGSEIDIEKIQSTLKECEDIAHEINKGIKLTETEKQPTDQIKDVENDLSESKQNTRENGTNQIEPGTEFCANSQGKTFEDKYIDNRPLSDHVELMNVNTNSDINKNEDCGEHSKLESDNIPTDLSSIKDVDQTNSSSGSGLLHTGELHDSVLVSLPSTTSEADSQYPDSLENMNTELSSQDASLTSTSLNSNLLHTGEFHDTVVVPLPVKVNNDLKAEIEKQGNSMSIAHTVSNNSEQLDTAHSPRTTENIKSEESKSIGNNFTTTGLLHTGELHDTVVVPLSIEAQHIFAKTNEQKEISRSKSIEEGLNELSKQNLTTIESQRGPATPTYAGLLHTGELHDTVLVPIPALGQHTTGQDNGDTTEEGSSQPETVPRQVDSGSQTTGEVHAVPIEVQLNEAPAGVAVLTSPRPISAVDGVSSVEDDIAQTPDKGALPIESGSNFSSPSDIQSMESETRKNATINNKSMEVEAATKIQAGFRGYQVRKQLKLKNGSSDINNQRRQLRRKSSGRITDNGRISQNKTKDPNDIEEKSAVKIQAGVRGFLVRRRQKKQKTQES